MVVIITVLAIMYRGMERQENLIKDESLEKTEGCLSNAQSI